jgi:predicted metal-dependent enzyme (double-stranded beta helix superfamily)
MQTPAALDAFVDACKTQASAKDHDAVASLLRELIGDPGFAESMPAFEDVTTSANGWTLGGEHICHQTPELTVMVLDTLPGVLQPPHDHEMHAIIGVFEGREDQRFYARAADAVSETAGRALSAGEVMVLGERAIHAISSPEGQAARAIHVYFGDIYAVDRSLYDPDTLEPVPYTGENYDRFCRSAA